MATFTPPTDNFVIPAIIGDVTNNVYLSKEERIANRLGSHIHASGRGRNVFLLTTGTYTERQPSNLGMVSKVYYGGHDNEITIEEAMSLIDAGYGSYVTDSRTNLVQNPNFEAGTPNWAGSNPTSIVTTSTTQKYIGNQSLRLERITSTGNLGCALPSQAPDVPAFGIPVTQGNTYTVSAYVFQGASGTVDIDLNYCFGVTSLVTSPVAFTPAINTWTRISATLTAPPKSDGLRIVIRFLNRPAGELVYVDAVLVEQASSAPPYFDGTYADPYAGYTIASQTWNGTANASTSTVTLQGETI
jgi:hypothetical protein